MRHYVSVGLAAVGSGAGGVVFPVSARLLIDRVGYASVHTHTLISSRLRCDSRILRFKWTMRILALMLLFALVIGNLTLKRRLPPKKLSGGLFNWAAFKSTAFSSYCVTSFLTYHGLFTSMPFSSLFSCRSLLTRGLVSYSDDVPGHQRN